MSGDMELREPGNAVYHCDHDEYPDKEQVFASNGDRLSHPSDPMEGTPLVPDSDPENGQNMNTGSEDLQDGTGVKLDSAKDKTCVAHRLWERMNMVVVGNLRLWCVIIILIIFVALVIGVSIVLCSVIHKDLDETYDSSLFVLPLSFNGTFQLTNWDFSPELLSPASNQSQFLSSQLIQKLTVLYSSSPALGRYFSGYGISSFSALRNDSVMVDYWLRFLIPCDDAELQRYTLSIEMVFNVFRQSVYDNDSEGDHFLYIDPSSLDMQVASGYVDCKSVTKSVTNS